MTVLLGDFYLCNGNYTQPRTTAQELIISKYQ